MATIEKNYQTNFAECFQAEACPVCREIDFAQEKYYRWYVLEYYNSASAILGLAKGGFCQRHAQRLSLFGKEVSFTYRYLASLRRQALERMQKRMAGNTKDTPPSFLEKWLLLTDEDAWAQSLRASEPCPVCESEENARAVTAKDTSDFLANAENRQLYQTTPILCWQHMIDVMAEASVETISFLAECHRQELIRLEADFTEYFRKTDCRYSQEPKGKEQDAWRKALRFFFRVTT